MQRERWQAFNLCARAHSEHVQMTNKEWNQICVVCTALSYGFSWMLSKEWHATIKNLDNLPPFCHSLVWYTFDLRFWFHFHRIHIHIAVKWMYHVCKWIQFNFIRFLFFMSNDANDGVSVFFFVAYSLMGSLSNGTHSTRQTHCSIWLHMLAHLLPHLII